MSRTKSLLEIEFLTLLLTLTEHTADLHRTVPFSLLADEGFVISLQCVAFITEILHHSAMSQTMAWRRVAGITPVLWHSWGDAVWTGNETFSNHKGGITENIWMNPWMQNLNKISLMFQHYKSKAAAFRLQLYWYGSVVSVVPRWWHTFPLNRLGIHECLFWHYVGIWIIL